MGARAPGRAAEHHLPACLQPHRGDGHLQRGEGQRPQLVAGTGLQVRRAKVSLQVSDPPVLPRAMATLRRGPAPAPRRGRELGHRELAGGWRSMSARSPAPGEQPPEAAHPVGTPPAGRPAPLLAKAAQTRPASVSPLQREAAGLGCTRVRTPASYLAAAPSLARGGIRKCSRKMKPLNAVL